MVSVALSAGIVLALATLSAIAQPRNDGPPAMISEAFARAGLTEVSNLRQRGATYTANARSAGGRPAIVVVDGQSGRIVGFRLIEPPPPRAAATR